MRSIRLSLVVYFLILEAAVLGAAAWLVYHTAGDSLRTEHDTRYQLLINQYEEAKQKEFERLEDALLSQARTLTDLTRSQFQWKRLQLAQYFPLGLLSTSLAPHGELLALSWASAGENTQLQKEIMGHLAAEITVNEELLPRDADSSVQVYYQINSDWGASWKSRSLGDAELPFDFQQLSLNKTIDWKFDDVVLPNGLSGRRIQFKAPATRWIARPLPGTIPSPRPIQPNEVAPTGEGRGNRAIEGAYVPWMVVHCVNETRARDIALGKLNTDLTLKLNQLIADSGAAEQRLLTRLGVIGVLTFAGTVFGGSLLVGLGLAPLRRLTDAVSRVTSHDFRLPLENRRLPRELDPIAERLRATLDELRRAFEREKQAAADISHELRTPVAALLATLDVALRKHRTNEEYRETLMEARGIGAQMKQLVERLLALAKLDAGVTKLQSGAVDVAELVEQCMALVRPLAIAQDLKVTAQCPPHVPWMTDGDKLREVLINLLHNAIQYNRTGGSVAIAVNHDNDHLEITITDTGIGIAEEALPHLFERFYRVDPSRQASELNAGLGLSIVRGYMDLLGGQVAVSSKPGAGTTFRLTFADSSADRTREAA